MTEIVRVLLDSGRLSVELALYVLLPVLVVMTALTRLLDHAGVLRGLGWLLSWLTRWVGVPGKGVLAILQILLVSFAAPVSTLRILDEDDDTDRAELAATLAMVLTMSQANAVFPLVTVGLSPWAILASSLFGGGVAAAVTYYFFARKLRSPRKGTSRSKMQPEPKVLAAAEPTVPAETRSAWRALGDGGEEGLRITVQALPVLVLAIFAVKVLEALGAVGWLEALLARPLHALGLPVVSTLPLATKYVAGGTAMLGVTLDAVESGALSHFELNRLAGFLINPLDLVGLAVLLKAGPRVARVRRHAIGGALVGIFLVKGPLHLLLFR